MRYWQVYALWKDGYRSGCTFDTPEAAEAFFDMQVSKQNKRLSGSNTSLGTSGTSPDDSGTSPDDSSAHRDEIVAIVWIFHDMSPGGTGGVVKKWELGGK